MGRTDSVRTDSAGEVRYEGKYRPIASLIVGCEGYSTRAGTPPISATAGSLTVYRLERNLPRVLVGKVRLGSSNTPVSGARVTAECGTALTDDKGEFALRGRCRNRDSLRIICKGLPLVELELRQGTADTVSADVRLYDSAQASSVTGQVVDDGLPGRPPMRGAVVFVRGRDLPTFTDSTGSFSFSDLPPGRTTVTVYWSWYLGSVSAKSVKLSLAPSKTARVTLSPGEAPLLLKSIPFRPLAVTVQDGITGWPLRKAEVGFPRANRWLRCNADGTVTAPAGTSVDELVVATAPGYDLGSANSADYDTDSIHMTVSLWRAGSTTITGELVEGSSNRPVPNARLTIGGEQVKTDRRGKFRVKGIFSTSSEFGTDAPGQLRVAPSLNHHADEEIRATVVIDPAPQGSSSGSIIGLVLDAATNEPLPGANIVVKGHELGAATDADGNYRITGVPPGKHTVTASYIGVGDQQRIITLGPGGTQRSDFMLRRWHLGSRQVPVRR
ncbi:MAG: carboxypeptidase regulatory-like domain-containing protein [bacterium]